MRFILNVLFVSAVSLGIGLGVTWWAAHTDAPFGSLIVGPWHALPSVGTPDVDAYTLANVAQRGELPLAVVDGIAFKATMDDTGEILSAACSYTVEGAIPAARLWSLSVHNGEGFVIPNPAERYGFTSAEALRVAGGGIKVAVGSQVRPGDWLPVNADGNFIVMLRLYDIPVGTLADRRETLTLPYIKRESCS
jgi:hypothetical protein